MASLPVVAEPASPAQHAGSGTVTRPEALHPALWRAAQLGCGTPSVCASGHAALDAELPGGGWPQGSLTELLLPHAGMGELRLLAPALVVQQRQGCSLMWLDPPAAPCAWALSALGIDVRHLVLVYSRPPVKGRARDRQPAADLLWSLENALHSGHLGAVLAWLPARVPADALRRLQLAAQSHPGPVFLLRDAAECSRPSAAPLRLLLDGAGPDCLRLHLFKRRGPPLERPLLLSLPPVLAPSVRARLSAGAERLGAVSAGRAASLPPSWS